MKEDEILFMVNNKANIQTTNKIYVVDVGENL